MSLEEAIARLERALARWRALRVRRASRYLPADMRTVDQPGAVYGMTARVVHTDGGAELHTVDVRTGARAGRGVLSITLRTAQLPELDTGDAPPFDL